ncbi:MAG: hypothetical protein PHT07_24070 [Paludibacter sp.]|nr:hypothetical protein [Paludibacter sp.]
MNKTIVIPEENMVTVKEMTKRVKTVLERHIKDRRVNDSDVADILRIKQGTFGVMKSKNNMPVDAVINFCERTGLYPESILCRAS